MTDAEIDALTYDQAIEKMRELGLSPVVSFFATIHRKSDERASGFTDDDLDAIDDQLEASDLGRWRQELKDHFRKA